MSDLCRRVRRVLELEGPVGVAGIEGGADHLESCDACYELMEQQSLLDEALAALPELDAPDELIERLLADELLAEPPVREIVERPRTFPVRSRWMVAVAATVVAAFGGLLFLRVGEQARTEVDRKAYLVESTRFQPAPVDSVNELRAAGGEGEEQRLPSEARAKREAMRERLEKLRRQSRTGDVTSEVDGAGDEQSVPATEEKEQLRALGYIGGVGADHGEGNAVVPASPAPPPPSPAPPARQLPLDDRPKRIPIPDPSPSEPEPSDRRNEEPMGRRDLDAFEEEIVVVTERPIVEHRSISAGTLLTPDEEESVPTSTSVDELVFGIPDAPSNRERQEGYDDAGASPEIPLELEKIPAAKPKDAPGLADSVEGADGKTRSEEEELAEVDITFRGGSPRIEAEATLEDRQDRSARLEEKAARLGASGRLAPGDATYEDLFVARAFLSEREQTEGQHFQSAEGIWKNTYLPGDPELRLLASRLEAASQATPGSVLDLARLGQPSDPVLDPPAQGALALSVRADRTALEDPARVLLQIGLRATERRPGQRPAMQLALVLDLRSGDPDGLQRALALALAEARRAGDRFHLFAFGAAEPLLAGPDDIRAGFVGLAVEDALAAGPDASVDASVVVDAALAALGREGGQEALLGTRTLLLAASEALGSPPRALVPQVHRAALDGIVTATVAVGSDASPLELDLLASAGQGGRQTLLERSGAREVLASELEAGGEVVARALRLRIRLAPGVELVGMPGSHRLGSRQARQARETERALDQRLARERGLEMDRDDDEDGILVMIPAFRAGDEHVVLVDVVASGPGPVAEVSLRLKDLVAGNNAVLRDHLVLDRGETSRGPLEIAVWKSLVGQRLHAGLERAADLARQGQRDAALEQIRRLEQLLRGLRSLVADLEDDPDLRRDAELVGAARALLEGLGPELSEASSADALRLAAARRWLGFAKAEP